MFDGAHHSKLHRRRVALKFPGFQLPDAVLGAEAAAEITHQIMKRAFHRGFTRKEWCSLAAGCLVEIEMQIAIADMAIGDEAAVGHIGVEPGGCLLNEL